MSRVILSLALIAVIGVGLTGCGGDEGKSVTPKMAADTKADPRLKPAGNSGGGATSGGQATSAPVSQP